MFDFVNRVKVATLGTRMTKQKIITLKKTTEEEFWDATKAVNKLIDDYTKSIEFLRISFDNFLENGNQGERYRAFYPEIRIEVKSFAAIDSRLSFGHVTEPGIYAATVTQPKLFENYLIQQISLLIENHKVPITISASKTPIPLHFAMKGKLVSNPKSDIDEFPLRDVFDVPDLSTTNDNIVNGTVPSSSSDLNSLCLFTAQRVDYSLARLDHYTATDPKHFQNFVLFTNYQFYVDEFEHFARRALNNPDSGYESFVGPENFEIFSSQTEIPRSSKLPQMPSYHLKRSDGNGITLVNIGVGPSNAKTATDHIAVLRPQAWLMLGHCAGLRNSQRLGDFVLAHAYLREDKVLDEDLPSWVPVPALAEVQIALEQAVADVTQLKGYDLKQIMRTGTVATVDNRNWELREQMGPVHRLSQSRAIALDMESATVAANGYRFRIPYGTLLCVSDKPLHGELKLPGMASEFYKTQVSQHLSIGVRTMEILQKMPLGRLQSRKLRSFNETAFL